MTLLQKTEHERRQIVDEFGDLDLELAPLKPKLSRREQLAKVIRSWDAASKPESSVIFSGDKFEVVLAPRTLETKLAPMAKIYRALGKDTFLRIASVTLTALKATAHPETVGKLTHQEQTGYRSLTVKQL